MRSARFAFVAAALLAVPVLAHADALDTFRVTGHGLDLAFSLPSSPVVGSNYQAGLYFYLGDVAFTENGTPMTADNVFFYTKTDDGGFTLADAVGDPIDGLNFTGPTLFTGTLKKPTFKLGTFDLTEVPCGIEASAAVVSEASLGPCGYKLKIDPAAAPTVTPEPGSLALLGTGALGVFGVVRRRLSL